MLDDDDDTASPGGGAPTGAPEPAAAPAPATTDAETDDPAPAETPKLSKADRRIAALSARLSAGEQERNRLAAEVERLRRGEPDPQPHPQIPADLLPVVRQAVDQGIEAQRRDDRIAAFHAAGRAAHTDWGERCQSLMQMGADIPFSNLLLEIQDGHRVAAALVDEPEELERIVGLRSDRARAIELGKYAAKLDGRPQQPRRPISNAPAPIRQVGGNRVVPSEASMSAQQLVEFYSKQALDARMRR